MSQSSSDFTEAVIVLANLMDRHGRLNDDSLARLETAVAILKQTPRGCLITSGWNYRPDTPIMIAHAMRDHAQSLHGIARDRILADGSARDTVGDAIFVKRNVVEPARIRELTVVTSAYHLHRTRQIFEFVFGNGYGMRFVSTSIDHAQGLEQAELASLAAFRATFEGISPGDTEAIYRRLLSQHPLYNGAVHPAYG